MMRRRSLWRLCMSFAAIYNGLVVTAILATLPAILSQASVPEAAIGMVIGSFFVGRLVLQIPEHVRSSRSRGRQPERAQDCES
jgi:MFS family permease